MCTCLYTDKESPSEHGRVVVSLLPGRELGAGWPWEDGALSMHALSSCLNHRDYEYSNPVLLNCAPQSAFRAHGGGRQGRSGDDSLYL